MWKKRRMGVMALSVLKIPMFEEPDDTPAIRDGHEPI